MRQRYSHALMPTSKNYISSSMIGDDCSRKIWYSAHEYESIPRTLEQILLLETKINTISIIINYIDNHDVVLIENDKSFRLFKEKGIRNCNYKKYDKYQFLMGKNGFDSLKIFIFNQDTGELWGEEIIFDDFHYQLLKAKAESIMMMKEPPSRINESPVWFQCRKCQFRKECHR